MDQWRFPWSKDHGSIEAGFPAWPVALAVSFPWSKDHGSIEADCPNAAKRALDRFPWSKDHGSIEAVYAIGLSRLRAGISVVERSRLH